MRILSSTGNTYIVEDNTGTSTFMLSKNFEKTSINTPVIAWHNNIDDTITSYTKESAVARSVIAFVTEQNVNKKYIVYQGKNLKYDFGLFEIIGIIEDGVFYQGFFNDGIYGTGFAYNAFVFDTFSGANAEVDFRNSK